MDGLEKSSFQELGNGAIKKSRKKKNPTLPGGPRGRPRKALVAMYHSQISGDKDAIKIRIRKSNMSQVQLVFYLIRVIT